jgi:hypothetical protein
MKRLSLGDAKPLTITEYGRVAFRVPETLKVWIDAQVALRGSAKAHKTRFITECVVDFLDSPDVEEVLAMSGLLPPSSSKHVIETASLTEPLRIRCWWAAIDNAVSLAKNKEPIYLEPTITHVIKSALFWQQAKG